MKDLPLYRRIQLELGIRFDLFPAKNVTYRQWLFDPSFKCVWPGKRVVYGDTPDGLWGSMAIETRGDTFHARFWWLGVAIRVLGLDVGFGLYYRKKFNGDS